ncbi:hypothetical protein, partial [Methylogaea oryzae]|uniref:hypothetical protein n=1 Tax=Methylogaea oryzae TaxID=1295382 RepID=UPI001C3F2842
MDAAFIQMRAGAALDVEGQGIGMQLRVAVPERPQVQAQRRSWSAKSVPWRSRCNAARLSADCRVK